MFTRHSAASQNVPVADKDFATDVEYYLTLEPRQLPSRYLYDALGSALFDAICELPWYPVTRAELGLLEAHGRAIFDHTAPLSRIVELGPGNGTKLMTLVEAGRHSSQGPLRLARHLNLCLIDVSAKALDESSHALAALDEVDIATYQAPYEAGLTEVTRDARSGGRTLVLFLGSNIGNFDRPGAEAFLGGIRAALGPGDSLLVGADLVKPERDLLLAYDDPLGVTAAFNRNLLVRINRELGGDFDVDAYGHRAVWNAEQSRVEMHLVSRRRQRVRVAEAGVEFSMDEGETIWTESSYKYHPEELAVILERTGFQRVEQWMAESAGFVLMLVGAA